MILYFLSVLVILVAPAIIGIFWGAPLIARELEAGTFRLTWNQSITRTRWLTVKLALIGIFFQRDEHREQVVGGREEHHAADREQRERVDLGVADAGQQPLAFLSALPRDRGRLRDERAHVVRGFRR